MTAIDKSASDKTNPTGEARAAKLIAWFNAGAGGKIQWGKPGDFDQCVAIAGKHMRPDQAKGFCSNRHQDATGFRPGKAPAERAVHKAGRLALLRRLLASHPAATAECPACRAKVSAFVGSCSKCGAMVAPATKALSAKDKAAVDAETERIKINREGPGAGPHKFKAATWTHPNGHPRCLLCGAEEKLPDDFDTAGVPMEKWPTAPCEGYAATHKALGVSTAAMVALYPSPEVARAIALEGGELPEELHVTLAYLGGDAVVRLDRDRIEGALAALADVSAPVAGEVGGLGRFNGGFPAGQEAWPLVALMDLPTLPSFRQRLVGALNAAGVDVVSNHGFTPHMTLAYVEGEDEDAAAAILAEGIEPTPLRFGAIVLAWGDDRTVFELAGDPPAPHPVVKAVAGPVIKADEAQRYTFAPLYPASPESPTAEHLDAHGDFATAEDLQAAVWDYVRKGDRTIRDQHRGNTAIGECVEIVSWPYEVTVPMTTAAGATVEKSFAPGTVFLGVVWTPTGWSDVVKGVKTGYSLGGVATRVAVETA